MLSNVSFKEFCEDLYSSAVLVLISTITMVILQFIWPRSQDSEKFTNLFQRFKDNLYIYQLFLSYFIAYIFILHYSRWRKIKILPDILDEYYSQIISVGFAILFGFSLAEEISLVTLCHVVNMTISLTLSCFNQSILKEKINTLTQQCHYLDMDKQELRSLLARTRPSIARQNKNDVIREMSDIVFSLKEKIPDGPYLELMNEMKSLHV